MDFITLLTVAVGGGIGALLRYLVAGTGQSLTLSSFPLGTLIVNLVGCALIGLVTAFLIDSLAQHRELLRLFLIVGILGGFTTFSTFAMDTFELLEDGRIQQAILYVLLSNVIGILVAWGFYKAGTNIFQSSTPV
jgi:CrcB protein